MPEPAGPPTSSMTLKLGTLLPLSGSLLGQGDATRAAIEVAVGHVNESNIGVQIELVHGDSGSSADDAQILFASIESLKQQGVTAVIGPRASGLTALSIPVLAEAGIVQISPASTAPGLSMIDSQGFFFRTVATNDLQGRVLADRIIRDGALEVAIVSTGGVYGDSIQAGLEAGLRYSGLQSRFFTAEQIAEALADSPDAVVVVSTVDDFLAIAQDLDALGVDWSQVYGVDANSESGELAERLGIDITGAVFTTAGVLIDNDFREEILALNPTVSMVNFAPESYDAVTLLALAALQAGSVQGEALRDALHKVGSDGWAVTDLALAAGLIRAGEDVDFDGKTGPLVFSKQGDLTAGYVSIYEYHSSRERVWVNQRYVEAAE